MRSLRYLVLGLVFIAIIAFSVANRHAVQFMLDPIAGPNSTIWFEAPLFIFLFGAVLAGFVIGAIVAWISQGRWRRAARQRGHEVFELRKENERLARHLRILERAPQIRAYSAQGDSQERPLIH